MTVPVPIRDFAASCRVSLEKFELETACQQLTKHLAKHLKDPVFLKACFGPADWEGRKVIYEDEQFGFCLCGHISHGPKEAKPHNHGDTWAIYGQVEGQTEMAEWALTASTQGTVSKIKSYTMNPGDARLYPQGTIHSATRYKPEKLIRIEGKNLDDVERSFFTPE